MTEAEKTRILLAEPDVEIAKELGKAFKERGYDAFYAKDGAKALQISLEKAPHVIVTEIALPILNGVKISQILKSNPKTRDVPILYLSGGEVNPIYLPFFRNAIVKKPFNTAELLSRIDASLMKVEKSREVQGDETKEIAGNLAQMSLVDLLQIFSMNKKSGALVVRREELGEEGMIFLKEGSIISANSGLAAAEKALYRLLGWDSGRFEYIPQDFRPEVNIRKSTDSLLMEGMRQLDEWKRMLSEFPPMESGIRLKVDPARLSGNLRPTTKEVLSLLTYYKQVSQVVNNSAFSDYDVMMTLHTLLKKGIAELFAGEGEKVKTGPLLTAEEGVAIKEALKTPFRDRFEMDTVKVPVFCSNPKTLRKMLSFLSVIEGFRPEKEILDAGEKGLPFGLMGKVKASDDITLLFTAFPLERFYSPLWLSLMGGSVGAIILRDEKTPPWCSDMPAAFRRTFRLNTAFLDFEKGLPAAPSRECFTLKMWEIKKEGVGEAMNRLFDAFLNL